MTTKCWDQMPGFCPWRSKSHGSVAWCPCTWLQEEVCCPRMHKGFLLDEQRWYCICEHVEDMCPWRQWYLTGGLMSPWLYMHSVFVVVVPDPTCKAHILPSSPPGQHDIFVRTESPTLIAVHHGTPGASTLFLSTGFSELFHFFSSIWFHSFNNVDTFLSFMSDTQTTSKIRHAVLKSKNKKTMLRMPYN